MTDERQKPEEQDDTKAPEDDSKQPSGDVDTPDTSPAEEMAESLEETLEVPKTEVETGATPEETTPPPSDVKEPAASEQATAESPDVAESEQAAAESPEVAQSEQPTAESLDVAASEQPTAELPDPSAPVQEQPPSPELVAPPTEAQPPAEAEPVTEDTTDFTLSDITLTDAGGGRLRSWLRDLRARLEIRRKPRSVPVTTPASKKRYWGLRPWQWSLVGVGVLVFLFALFVGVDAGVYYDKVHHGISVAGEDLSRNTTEDATQTLTALVEEAQRKPIELTNGSDSWEVLPSDLGTQIDVPAAVAKAMALTREGNVVTDLGRKIALYFKSKMLPLEGTLDDAKMEALLTTISEALDVPAVNATLKVVDGAIEVVESEEGLVVDQEALRARLTEILFTLHDTELAIPMVVASPDLVAVDVEPALAQAEVMISADLLLTYEGKTIATLTPLQIIAYLDVAHETESDQTKAVPVLSEEKMVDFFDAIQPWVGTPPVNATFEMDFEAEEPYPLVLVEGINGEGLDREGTAAALTQAAMSPTGRTAEVVLMSVEPDLATADVQAMGIKDLLGDYRTTPYVGTKGRQHNVRLATSLCSGVFLAPGEEFNTDLRLGTRDAAHGWATAPGITGPGKLEDVYGGGICQVSTTLFNAAFLAGLEITERHNHSIFINHYPNGRDATVTAGGKNMRFRNDTDDYVFIYGWSTGINTRFWVWGVSDGREVQPIKFSGFSVGGMYPTETRINKSLPLGSTEEYFPGQRARSCTVSRTIVFADGTSKTESWSSKWSMLPKVIETNPAPTTTSPPTTAPSPTSTTIGP